MKATIRLTLAGLVGALRWRAHALAEEPGRSYPDGRVAISRRHGRRRASIPQPRIEEPSDDRRGR